MGSQLSSSSKLLHRRLASESAALMNDNTSSTPDLEKLKKKSSLLMEEEMTEGDKAKAIASLMSKAAKKKPKQHVQLVVARGANRAISGRPRGTKGKYKMVDPRMKKEARALKRVAKKKR